MQLRALTLIVDQTGSLQLFCYCAIGIKLTHGKMGVGLYTVTECGTSKSTIPFSIY